ncbi:MAG TPA: RNA 2',3'-cyclic phosphodiesterase [Candidatus Elarobacter sp.]|jgi:2'-5' RNA ligase
MTGADDERAGETPGERRAPRWRLFVAADVDDAARAACAGVAERLRAHRFDARWVAPENYHLTVAFIGAVEQELVGAVRDAVREAAARVPPFGVPLDAVGAFPNERRARIAWVGSGQPLPPFEALCAVVRGALAVLGFTFDRHADPHVTLARADGRAALPPVAPPRIEPVRIGALTLYRSFTERGGARYTPVDRFALQTGE